MNSIKHESAHLHVTGQAIYIDDMNTANLLHGLVYTSPHAHTRIVNYDLSDALALNGVAAILSAKDIPAVNQMGPVFHDEPALAESLVVSAGQAIFLIAAETLEIAHQARNLIKVDYEILEPILTLRDAIAKDNKLHPSRKIESGDVEKTFTESQFILTGELETGAQEHWYLETQVALAIKGEGDEMKVYSSTQNPTETQLLVAEVLGVSRNQVEVETRRMGGGFGGKETNGNHTAVWASLLSNYTKRPVKLRLNRDDDQRMTGKRHPYLIKYKAGFDGNGLLHAVDVELNANAGAFTDLSMAILERAMLHADNAYFIPNMRIIATAYKTNTVSNTAFRGFGGPQGMSYIETIIDRIARQLNLDSAEVRLRNFYGIENRNITPYGEIVENNRLYKIYNQIIETSDYFIRKKNVDEFNGQNEFTKRGIALTPVKFGISFTSTFLNQAGALVNLYTDGSVLVNHGGTEMGQGLYTKMRQIAALEFGIDIEKVRVNATNTSKVPNTSPTAASAGADLNGMAVKNAIEKLKKRISEVVVEKLCDINVCQRKTVAWDLVFENNMIYDNSNPDRKIGFAEALEYCRFKQVSLSATGFYKTPDIFFDRATGQGRPFHYFAFGMCVSEIDLDVLTGRVKVLRTDILHDVGNSLNPEIDKGQIEGGFVQGLGWVTTEDIKWNSKGHMLNYSPDTYKIPTIQDIPADFRVSLLQDVPNPNTIRQSKAVGEPPLMLALSAWLAIKYAISAVANHQYEPDYQIPATNEYILMSIEKLKKNLERL